jgi:DNA-binding transcriptional LysR family regulator
MPAILVHASLWLLAVAAGSREIRAIDGTPLRPFAPAGVAHVLLFVATDCPVSNAYAPEIQRICGAAASRGIACSLIYEDPHVGADAVRRHLDDYRYHGITAAIDRDGGLAREVRASITPEAVVVDRSGTIRYRGRIDNFYAALGRPRQVVTAHDLQDALTAVAAGRPVATPRTEAIGCYIVSSDMRRN